MATNHDRLWKSISQGQVAHRGVVPGTGFGRSEGLKVRGKIFAMHVNGELVVKLPRSRVQELADSGIAHPFNPGRGRVMNQWAAVDPSASRRWRHVVEEARAFVGPN